MTVLHRQPPQSAAKLAVAALLGGVSLVPRASDRQVKSVIVKPPTCCSLQNTHQALLTPPQGGRLKSILASNTTTKGAKKSLRFNSKMPRHKWNPTSSSLCSDVETSFRRPERLGAPCSFLRHCCDILVERGALERIPDALQNISPSRSVIRVLDLDCHQLPTEEVLHDAAEYSAFAAFSILDPLLSDTLSVNVAVPMEDASASLGHVDLSEVLLCTMLQLSLASPPVKERFNRMHVTFDKDCCTVTLINGYGGYVECVKDYVHFVAEPRSTYDLMSRIHSELCSKVLYDDQNDYILGNNDIYDLARWMSRHPISMAGFREIAREVFRQVKLLESNRNVELLPYYFWHRLKAALEREVETPMMADMAALRVLDAVHLVSLINEPSTTHSDIYEKESAGGVLETSTLSTVETVKKPKSPTTLPAVETVERPKSPTTLSAIKTVKKPKSPTTLPAVKTVKTPESPSILSAIVNSCPKTLKSSKSYSKSVKPFQAPRRQGRDVTGPRRGYMNPTLSTIAKERPPVTLTRGFTPRAKGWSYTHEVAASNAPRFVTTFATPVERRTRRK
ncbi:MAG: hypothetical protein KVP17_003447 [Porospora cf. gigantea B]|uniref:uncharacterized protein n=1 Tax=Porospora cf. gigantea B TaxID=2853592 RepID=UPI0035718634|nr:MAG: hypothetical protein KVP17_003447 [Porospora cf. gigantea B]